MGIFTGVMLMFPVPEAFLAIVIMAAAMSPLPRFAQDPAGYDCLEYFAGRARISRLARSCGYRTLATDLKYDSSEGDARSSLNLNRNSGLSTLG